MFRRIYVTRARALHELCKAVRTPHEARVGARIPNRSPIAMQ
jgi:hypothetical protein